MQELQWMVIGLFFVLGSLYVPASAQTRTEVLTGRMEKILKENPELKHALVGLEIYSLDEDAPLYAYNEEKLFGAASTTKLVTEGTALALLGPDYRFHTRVYRSGAISDGVLKGDLILVASGDLNISGRVRPDDTLAFENVDHDYADVWPSDARPVPGDPLLVFQELAGQAAKRGINKIDGRVIVDDTLFHGSAPDGSDVSPMVVNDNLVDITIVPDASAGAPARLEVLPVTSYVRFLNQVTTGAANSEPAIERSSDTANPDGTHIVTLSGSIPAGKLPILFTYNIRKPKRLAEVAFVGALQRAGIKVEISAQQDAPNLKSLSSAYRSENIVAEHVSPPLSEEVKVTLKTSQNFHAAMMPYILGALLGPEKPKENSNQAGFALERNFLEKAGLDVAGTSQSTGAGGGEADFFSPSFMVHYLAFMKKQKYFEFFKNALPIMGRDGSLWNAPREKTKGASVWGKTGDSLTFDSLNQKLVFTGKGLVGYIDTVDGQHLAFAFYFEHYAFAPTSQIGSDIDKSGEVFWELIAAAARPLNAQH